MRGWVGIGFVGLLGILMGSGPRGAEAAHPTTGVAPSGVRIGVFDSRAVAIAYYRSEAFRKRLGDLRAQRDQSQAKGDEKAVARWEETGRKLQESMHQHGFGPESDPEVMARLKPSMPLIAKEAQVALIVSKWDLPFVQDEVERVDVTRALVKVFEPDESTLRTITEIQKKAPIMSLRGDTQTDPGKTAPPKTKP